MAFFNNEISNFNQNQSLIKKEFEALVDIMKLSKYFNDIIKNDDESKDNYFNYDDIAIFVDENDNIVEIESLISKNINPSLKYYIIKNLNLLNVLFNSKLKKEEILAILKPQIDENYIPFWIFLFRNMSSIECIEFDNINNSLSKDITIEARQKVDKILEEGKADKLDNSWLNLMLNEVPKEILMSDARLYYIFFNNLVEKLNHEDILNENIKSILKYFYFDILEFSFKGEINTLLEEDISKSNNNICNLIKSPREYIENKIYNDYSEKTKIIATQTYFDNLEKEINNFLDKIPDKLKELKKMLKLLKKHIWKKRKKMP